jgi:hypothetical protein
LLECGQALLGGRQQSDREGVLERRRRAVRVVLVVSTLDRCVGGHLMEVGPALRHILPGRLERSGER